MSEKGSEPDIEARRFNVAEVPLADLSKAIQLFGSILVIWGDDIGRFNISAYTRGCTLADDRDMRRNIAEQAGARFGGRPAAMLVTAIAGEVLGKGSFRDDLKGRATNRSRADPGLYRPRSSSHGHAELLRRPCPGASGRPSPRLER